MPPLKTYSALNHFAVIQTPTAAKYFFFYIFICFLFFQFVFILNGKFDFFLERQVIKWVLMILLWSNISLVRLRPKVNAIANAIAITPHSVPPNLTLEFLQIY